MLVWLWVMRFFNHYITLHDTSFEAWKMSFITLKKRVKLVILIWSKVYTDVTKGTILFSSEKFTYEKSNYLGNIFISIPLYFLFDIINKIIFWNYWKYPRHVQNSCNSKLNRRLYPVPDIKEVFDGPKSWLRTHHASDGRAPELEWTKCPKLNLLS